MSLKYQIVPVTPYQQNCSIIWCDVSLKAAVIDPGGDLNKIISIIKDKKLQLQKILLTHGHLDHVGGTDELRVAYQVPIEGPEISDLFWIEMLPDLCKQYGFPMANSFIPDRWLNQGDKVFVGEESFQVLHTPGHTPGHIVFYHAETAMAWVGDVLFSGSIGRTDFPQGDYSTLISSIRERLWPLGDDVTFVPGHGPLSTFGIERKHNPFVADNS